MLARHVVRSKSTRGVLGFALLLRCHTGMPHTTGLSLQVSAWRAAMFADRIYSKQERAMLQADNETRCHQMNGAVSLARACARFALPTHIGMNMHQLRKTRETALHSKHARPSCSADCCVEHAASKFRIRGTARALASPAQQKRRHASTAV